MAKLRLSPEIALGLDVDSDEVECVGTTVHACIDEASRKVDRRIAETLLEHAPGELWTLAADVEVLVNGADVRTLGGLGTPVAPTDVIEAAPLKGNAAPMDNRGP